MSRTPTAHSLLLLVTACTGGAQKSEESPGASFSAAHSVSDDGVTTEADELTSSPSSGATSKTTAPTSDVPPSSSTSEASSTSTSEATPADATPATTPAHTHSSDETGPATNSDNETTPPASETLIDEATQDPLSFAKDIWPLWVATRDPVFVYRGMGSYSGCADETAPCHGAQAPGAQLSMTDIDTAYAQMLNTASVSGLCAGSQRVVEGDPENSCLIQFYVGRLGKEDLDWVDDAEIELMREWIRQGALP